MAEASAVAPKMEESHDHADAFGDKSISWWGSFVLNLNNVMGPACVLLPFVNHQAGWFTPFFALLIIFVLSSFACTMLCEAAQRIPGNHNFHKRIEFCDLVRYYYGHRAYVVSQIAYNVSLQASNIAAMIVSAQVLDDFIIHIFGTSYALDYVRFMGIAADMGHAHSASGQIWFDPITHEPIVTVISLGYVLSMVLCIPFGIMKLDENMWFQWLSFGGLLLFTAEFIVQFVLNMIPGAPGFTDGTGADLTPVFTLNQSQVLGLAMFAYAYVVTIPSWLNEKQHGVNVNSAIWWPALTGFVMKVLIGLLGGWAFLAPTSNILVNLAAGCPSSNSTCIPQPMPEVTRYSSYLWNLLTLVPGIPILAIMVKYNLITGKIANPFFANILGVVLPWVITAFCYESNVLNTLCNWIAILVQGYINFLVPIMLYRRALIEFPNEDDGVEWRRRRKLPDEDAPLDVRAISLKVKAHEHVPVSGTAGAQHRSEDSEERQSQLDEGGPHANGGDDDDSKEGSSGGGGVSPARLRSPGSKMFSPLARAPSLARRQAKALAKEAATVEDGNATPLLDSASAGRHGLRGASEEDDDADTVATEERAAHHDESDEDEAASGSRVKVRGDFTDLEGSVENDADGEDHVDEAPVQAVPSWMRTFISPIWFATGTAVFFSVLCTAFVIFNVVEAIAGAASG